MSQIDFAALAERVSKDEPCGPDLDLAGDLDYLNYLASAEGKLPASFFSIDRSSIDFDAEEKAIAEFLQRTRDIRLLVLSAKFSILNKDLGGFCDGLAAIATLLNDQWDHVHPRGEDGNYSMRMAPLFTLDDLPVVVLPLQYAPLAQTRRSGPISFRTYLVATGEAEAREGEQQMDASSIAQSLSEADEDELAAVRDSLTTASSALKQIVSISSDRAGYEQAVSLERLPPLVDRMLGLVNGGLPGEAPGNEDDEEIVESEDSDPTADAVGGSAGAVANANNAADALDAVEAYFSRMEPSSPSLLLTRQARQLVGKSFIEAMSVLRPQLLEAASIKMGRSDPFRLPVQQLGGREGSHDAPDDNGHEADPASEGSHSVAYNVQTRAQAVELLKAVESFYKSAEPSSPIPVLIERACSFTSKDFFSLMAEFSPPETD